MPELESSAGGRSSRRGASRLLEDRDGYVVSVVDLYHRTSSEAAAEIARTGRFISRCQDHEHAFFTDNPSGKRSRQYGQALVHVVVPAWAAILDEVYSDEAYARVRLEDLAGCSAKVVTLG